MTEPPPPLAQALDRALAAGEPLRWHDDDTRVFADHAAPLLAVHRCPAAEADDPARDARAACSEAHRLATLAPAYVLTTGVDDDALAACVATVGARLAAAAPVLAVELWTPLDLGGDAGDVDPFHRRPGFTLFVPSDAGAPLARAAEALADALSGVELSGQGADMATVSVDAPAPPGRAPLWEGVTGLAPLGLAVDAVFVNGREGEFYPGVLDELRAALAEPLDAAARAFLGAHSEAAERPGAPAVEIGRRHLEPAADAVDRGLAAVSAAFGFLLQVTPVNAAEAWDSFQADRTRAPEFLYRPLTFDADAVRRELFALRLDRVEDPIVADLLRERRDETEAKIRLVLDIETPQFLPGSVALYGAPDDALVALARDLLHALPAAGTAGTEVVGPTVFAAEARAEIGALAAQWDAVDATVTIRDDLPGSLMVSHGQLLVGAGARVPAERVRALLAHEVGTHVLTYYTGAAQPLRLLQHGLADYEGLQEGLAVLSEWLVGGLTAERLRTLAARVLGADALARGAALPETVGVLEAEAGLTGRAAFAVALRLHRGGGLTKDLIYLRGLRDLLAYLGRGGELWPLLAGKMGLRHVEPIARLTARGLLRPARLRPRWAADPDALARLDRARAGLSVLDLVPGAAPRGVLAHRPA